MNYLVEQYHVHLEDLEEVQEYLDNTYGNSDDYEYADNLRIAWTAIPSQLEEYEEIRRGGCCGNFEGQLTCKSGRTYYIGFNYGH